MTVLVAVLFPSVHPCNEVKCSIRSYLLHTQANTSSKSLLRVDVDNNGIPTGVSVTGQGSQSKYTSFVLKHCVRQIGSTTPKLVTTFHWKHNQSYTLAIKSSQIALEFVNGAASMTDSHRFLLRDVRCGVTSCVAIKSGLQGNGYITATLQGSLTLDAGSRRDRRAWFLLSCST